MGATGNGSAMVESVKMLSNLNVVIRMKLMAIISFRMGMWMGMWSGMGRGRGMGM